MNRRFLFSLLGAVLCGLVAILITQRIISNRINEGPGNITKVVVAATQIPTGTTITTQMVKFTEMKKNALPAGAITDLTQVVGKIAKAEIVTYDYVLSQNLAKLGESLILGKLGEGKRAMSIRVDDASSITGFATPGNFVDVVAVLSPGNGASQVSTVIAQNLKIMAINQETDPNNGHSAKSSGTVTLEVTQGQAASLTLAGRDGNLHLIGRNPVDKDELPPIEVIKANIVDTPPAARAPALQTEVARVNPTIPNYFPSPSPKVTPSPSLAPTKMVTPVKIWRGSVVQEVQVTK